MLPNSILSPRGSAIILRGVQHSKALVPAHATTAGDKQTGRKHECPNFRDDAGMRGDIHRDTA